MQMPSLDTRSHIGADILSHSLDNDSDPAALKRKSDAEDGDGKRTRQRTGRTSNVLPSAIAYAPFSRPSRQCYSSEY